MTYVMYTQSLSDLCKPCLSCIVWHNWEHNLSDHVCVTCERDMWSWRSWHVTVTRVTMIHDLWEWHACTPMMHDIWSWHAWLWFMTFDRDTHARPWCMTFDRDTRDYDSWHSSVTRRHDHDAWHLIVTRVTMIHDIWTWLCAWHLWP